MLLGKIIAGIVVLVLAIPVIYALYLGLVHLIVFYRHRCKYCGKRMDYKGFKENAEESHYLFHCPHCGAWEEISTEEMVDTLLNIKKK